MTRLASSCSALSGHVFSRIDCDAFTYSQALVLQRVVHLPFVINLYRLLAGAWEEGPGRRVACLVSDEDAKKQCVDRITAQRAIHLVARMGAQALWYVAA